MREALPLLSPFLGLPVAVSFLHPPLKTVAVVGIVWADG